MQDWVDSVDKETERRQDMAVKMMELDLTYGGGRSRSRSGTSGSSDQDIADKAAIMAQIKSRLPEDSQIVPQLAGASLETLKKFASGQDALYEYHLRHTLHSSRSRRRCYKFSQSCRRNWTYSKSRSNYDNTRHN